MGHPHVQEKKALVLLSGGQDSAACLAWALTNYAHVETVGFSYGQRHHVEMVCRLTFRRKLIDTFPSWKSRLGDDHILDISVLGQISETALTQEVEIEHGQKGLPNTFVPGRNLLFFSLAAALGYRRGIFSLVGGMCQTDYSGYPDCRKSTLHVLETAIKLGTEEKFEIVTPLMWRTKAQTWAMCHSLGGASLVDLITEHTHTCYRGERTLRHNWGYGCGACPACDLRSQGFFEWRNQEQV